MISIPLVFTQPYPCSYLDAEFAQLAFVRPIFEMTTGVYAELIQQGFRRNGDEVYIPHCQHCAACIPARVRVAEFEPNRSQKRCRQKNRETQVEIKSAEFCQEHFQLYQRYLNIRHNDGEMVHANSSEYIKFLSSSWCNTIFVEFSIAGKLAAVAVIDDLGNALSAVYTFFDPDFADYSLGVYAVLWQIDWAKQQQKEFVYLGFWIKQCKKMSYKSNYQPLQILTNNQWSTYDQFSY